MLSPKVKASVATSRRSGTIIEKRRFEETINSADPMAAPMIVTQTRSPICRPLNLLSSRLKSSAPPKYPGKTATALVALAATGGTPASTRAGKVRKVPPPASVLSVPASRAATSGTRKSIIGGADQDNRRKGIRKMAEGEGFEPSIGG